MYHLRRLAVAFVASCVLLTTVPASAVCGDVTNPNGSLDILDLIKLVNAILEGTQDDLECIANMDSNCPVGSIIGVDEYGQWACGLAAE